MKAYKGFNKDMTCTPGDKVFQYEEGKTYEEDTAELCRHGFHACEDPIDCFGYYSPASSAYREVELDDVSAETSDDTKICGKKISIGGELNFFGIAKAHVEYVKSKLVEGNSDDNTGYQSAATNTGDRSAATNTGDRSAATNTGYQSAATNTGYQSAATNTGNRSAATNTGDRSAATNTGYQSAAEVGTGGSVAIVTGCNSKAKAGLGSAIVICERGKWDGKTFPLIGIKAAIVDGVTVKADTWYKLVDGEFVEVEE